MEVKPLFLTMLTGVTALALLTPLARAQTQTLFVADGHDTIWEIQGGTITPFSTGIGGPQSIAFASNGHLFSADIGSGSILDIAPDGSRVAFTSGLHQPSSLTFDSSGNLYIGSQLDSTIVEYPNVGGVLSTTPIVIDPNILYPFAIAVDSHGNIYTNDGGSGSIDKIDAITHNVTTFAAGTDVTNGMTFDSKGNLWGAELDENTVVEISPAGKETFFGLTGLESPSGLAFDSLGDLYVTNRGGADGGFVLEYTNNGGTLSNTPIDVPSDFPGSLNDVVVEPTGVPEPSSLTLAALGIFAGQFSFRRRKRR
jgi:sugar lactone lactonase YvrE